MSARAPRRTFATPFVLTLAAIPACTVQSAPPPQGPTTTTQTETHDHHNEPPHANPPGSDEQPSLNGAYPDGQGPTTAVSNPPRPDVAQATPDTGPTAPQPRGYREWTVTKTKGKCTSMVKVHCPEGAMCNPPPPAKYDCPKFMQNDDHIAVVQRTEKADCFVDYGDFNCPPAASCNPPRPQQVACPK